MEAVQNYIKQLEETNRGLVSDRDRLKRLASLYQEEAFQEKLKCLTMGDEYSKTREEERSRQKEVWEREREKEREEWDGMMKAKIEDLERTMTNERGEWAKQRAQEQDALVKVHLKDREEWEKRLEMMKNASEKLIDEENLRWTRRLVQERAEWEGERDRERADWRRRLKEERERLQRTSIEPHVVHRQIAYVQSPSDSFEKTPKREDLEFPSMPTPHQTESPRPSTQVFHSVTVKRESLASHHLTHKSSPDIIDLSCDSPSPVVKMELDPSPKARPEPIVIDDDEPVGVTEQESRLSHKPESYPTTTPLIPTPAPIGTSSTLLPVKKSGKIEGFLSHSRREEYLGGTSLFSIAPDYLPVSISRLVLTRLYGSKTMGLDWMSSDSRYKLLTPSYEWNPDMPRAPGEAGLLLITYDTVVKYSPWTLFYKLETTKNVRWGYAGEYVCKEVGKFMKEEFAAQSDVVKKTWGDNVCLRRAEGAMLEMRARMTLRKHWKREPTQDEIKAEASKIKRNMPSFVLTSQDVIDSIVSGEEHIKVFSMQCVDYIHTKAKALMTEQEKYEREEEIKIATKSKGKVSSGKGRTKKDTSSRKRLRDSPVDTASDTDDNIVHEHVGSDSPLKPPQKRRKTVAISRSAGTSITGKSYKDSQSIIEGDELSSSLDDDSDDSDFYCDD